LQKVAGGTTRASDKSFLVLFFKKELLSSCLSTRQPAMLP
jgi:hypothetical protein